MLDGLNAGTLGCRHLVHESPNHLTLSAIVKMSRLGYSQKAICCDYQGDDHEQVEYGITDNALGAAGLLLRPSAVSD